MKITVMSTRSDGWWSSTSDDIPGFVTQTRSLVEIREYAQDIAALSGFSAQEVEDVDVDVHVVGELGELIRARQEGSGWVTPLVTTLSEQGISSCDIGTMLGISADQVEEILKAT